MHCDIFYKIRRPALADADHALGILCDEAELGRELLVLLELGPPLLEDWRAASAFVIARLQHGVSGFRILLAFAAQRADADACRPVGLAESAREIAPHTQHEG